ncbi:cbb3-type cytochrome c oxidase N-terminal domain-containing protein [Maribacter sp.]|uniref:cbb3-type cytochrome c oxidase N-terminal domain-containing protein n=1 Tax=Maribacter sp. TaxID=1897614 RepID=UPI0025BE4CF5|nr:cbb3-type cytochrome c oxidase N-terminal domain-containing protein [Maribacter sp.]
MKNMSPWWIRIPVIFFLIFGMMEFFIDSGDKPAIIEYPITQFFMLMVLLILIGIEVILKSIESVLYQTLSEEARVKYNTAKDNKWENSSTGKLFQKLSGNKPIEIEGEIVLDHDYDGIKELDNTLPPWWVYMFYATIVFAIVYLLRFEVFDGYNQDLEYDQEVAAAQIAIDEYKKTAKGLVDANTVELLTEVSDIKAGEAIFTANCVACHMADGGGGIGPNLTDKNWILGGGIKNIFHTISEGGRDGKGMVAWKQNLKPAEIAQVASYVIQEIGGKTPANPKAAEGDIWVDPNAPAEEIPEQVTDSTSVVVNE